MRGSKDHQPTAAATGNNKFRRRVLILDFDFFSTIGGGQVFYRRVVERNPSIDFWYPSYGADLRLSSQARLPSNARPFIFDARLDVIPPEASDHWLYKHYNKQVSGISAAVQGMTFQAVDIPSYFPAVDIARSVLTSYGVTVERIAIGLVGWQTASVKNGYTAADADTLSILETSEKNALETADVRYTISDLQQTENAGLDLPIELIDMQDAIESFDSPAPSPPGEGPPDLWYVGRLDGAKGPDLFIDLVSRMPRASYRSCFFSGPDNTWDSQSRWSQHLLDLAKSKNVEASYEGLLPDAELRSRVFQGRTVLVVPSRTDAFNYVALEAVLNGCPLLLSERAGALGFLRTHYPYLAPPAMRPEELDLAATELQSLLSGYEDIGKQRRQALLDRPFPSPREGFMDAIYQEAAPVRASDALDRVGKGTTSLRQKLPLLTPGARDWRPARSVSTKPALTVVIPTLDRPALLAPTLSCLTRQTLHDLEVLVVDDGSDNALEVQAVVQSFSPMARYLRIANAGEAGAVNRGIAAARGEYVNFLSDDDAYAPELLAEAVAILDRSPEAIGTYPDWDLIDTCGYFVEAHRLPEFERRLILCAHWGFPGPGVVVRRRVLQAIGGRDLSFRFLSDFDLWLRATGHGDMIHIPRKLAYRRRLNFSSLIPSDKYPQMAQERIRLVDKFYADPLESTPKLASFRKKAYAEANLAAASILEKTAPA